MRKMKEEMQLDIDQKLAKQEIKSSRNNFVGSSKIHGQKLLDKKILGQKPLFRSQNYRFPDLKILLFDLYLTQAALNVVM